MASHLCSLYVVSTVDVTARSASAMMGCPGAYASNLRHDNRQDRKPRRNHGVHCLIMVTRMAS